MDEKEKIDYRAIIREAVNSPHNDGWAERTYPNSGSKISIGMFKIPDDFTNDYVESMDERYKEQ